MIRRKAEAKCKKAQAGCAKAKTGFKKAGAFSKAAIIKDIKTEARILKISAGSAEKYAEKVAEKVSAWAEKREKVTRDDLNRLIAKEIAKYNKDLAFMYKNRGKII